MSRAYYNENEPYAIEWLRNLIAAGLIPAGDVDSRSVSDVRPDDLKGYTQAHFFAGIGGWAYAARLAGWPDTRPLWSGSCPCQPFSSAGKGLGAADPRHLWPVWFPLIRECRPPIVVGEQVPAAIPKGWLDLVFDDLEGARYACGAIIAPAAGVGAPHIRDRLWWVAADADRESQYGQSVHAEVAAASEPAPDASSEQLRQQPGRSGGPDGHGAAVARDDGAAGVVAIPERGGCEGRDTDRNGPGAALPSGWWESESGIRRVAHGVSGRVAVQRTVQQGEAETQEEHWYSRVGALQGLGNAIVPQLAATFLRAVM